MPVAKPISSSARVIAHVDMDCFYVQVEQRKHPDLRGLPTAVVQYNSWKGGGLIAVSYEARKYGVKRSMRGDEAKAVCPEIHLVQVPVARGKADLNTYRNAGSEVVSILSRKGRCERASIDEVYLDLTDAAETMLAESPPESLEEIDDEALRSHILGLAEDGRDVKENVRLWLCGSDAGHHDKLLACGAIIVARLRMQVLKETDFTCSAGIADNKMLAKLASGMNKPAQQTVVPTASVNNLLGPLPIKKMKQLGGKLGDSLLSDLRVKTVGDLLQFSLAKLQDCYGINTGTWLWNVARGISGEEVEGRILPKSHGSGKTFPGPCALQTMASVEHWLNELCEELSERLLVDLDQNNRIAHTLTLHARAYKSCDTESQKKFPSKSCPLRYGTAKIQKDAFLLFQSGLREFIGYGMKTDKNQKSGWGITALSVSASKLVTRPQETPTINKFFPSHGPVFPESSQPCSERSVDGVALLPSNVDVHPPAHKSFGLKRFSGSVGDDSIRRFFFDQTQSCSPMDQAFVKGALCSLRPESNSEAVKTQATPSNAQLCEERMCLPAKSASSPQGQKQRNLKAASSSILNFLKSSDQCSSLSTHEKNRRYQADSESSSSVSAANSLEDHHERLDLRESGRWTYNVDEIDQNVIDELPPDIKEELRAWMRPRKQPNIAKRSFGIASYFRPAGDT